MSTLKSHRLKISFSPVAVNPKKTSLLVYRYQSARLSRLKTYRNPKQSSSLFFFLSSITPRKKEIDANFEIQKKLMCFFRFSFFGDDKKKVTLDCINASFVSPLLERLRHQVDVVLFNPPYVPTGQHEALTAQQTNNNKTTAITGAWAGGIDGMQITNHFLEIVQVRPKK